MTFEDAIALAQTIRKQSPTWTIVAIGPFVPVADINDSTPWAVRVRPRGSEQSQVLRTENDYLDAVDVTFGNRRDDRRENRSAGAAEAERVCDGMLF